jgi:hypothetical protein
VRLRDQRERPLMAQSGNPSGADECFQV